MTTPIINKLQSRGNLFRHTKDGALLSADLKAIMIPMTTEVVKQKLLLDTSCDNKSHDILYYTGFFQGVAAVRLLNKYGFKEPKKVFDVILQQSSLGGHGNVELQQFSPSKRHVMVKLNSIFAKQTRAVFGVSKVPVDHFVRGNIAGVLTELFGCDMVGVEKQCIVQGKDYCILSFVPLEDSSDLSSAEKEQVPASSEIYKKIKKLKPLTAYSF